MWIFIQEGGFSMFVVLFFGALTLATAFWFAVRPDAKHLGFIKWMMLSTFGSILVGITANFSTVFAYLSSEKMESAELRKIVHILLEGAYESLRPGVLGFTILSLVALLAAVGRRRLDARLGADTGVPPR